MAKVKAKVSFCGIVSMGAGETRDIKDEKVVKDLLKAGYVVELKTTKKGDGDESK